MEKAKCRNTVDGDGGGLWFGYAWLPQGLAHLAPLIMYSNIRIIGTPEWQL